MNIIQKNQLELLKKIFIAMDDKFAKDIKILDLKGISDIADYFILASGNNPNQIKAIADAVEEVAYKNNLKLNHSEGYQNSNWILLDFYNVVVHIFDEESRNFYDLERIWADGKIINVLE